MALTLPGIAKLRNAALVLRETTGFAYLPIIVPHEVAGRDALQELQSASAVADDQWHEVVWPKSAASAAPSLPATPEVIAEQREALAGQRRALLQSFDTQLAQDRHAGHALVLDASPSTRHALATEVVTYLNQRREPMRSHQRRLIVVWPAALSDILLGGAPDLWSQRALSVVLANEDSVVTAGGDKLIEAASISPSRSISTRPNPIIEAQLAQWFTTHDLRQANLSGADGLTLAQALYERHDLVEAELLAQAVEQAYPDDEALCADAMYWRSLALHGQGRHRQALDAAVQAVMTYRQLASASPNTYEPRLAGSLSNLASFQSACGNRAGALVTALDAVEIHRRCANANPAAHEPDLAKSLTNLAGYQSETGDQNGAFASAFQALEIYRRLASVKPAAIEPDLARSLGNFAICQSQTGDRHGARANALAATEIYRRIADINPVEYEAELGRSLSNLASIQIEAGEPFDAIASSREAVDILRRLARANPAAHESSFAYGLNNLAYAQIKTGDSAGALTSAIAAIEIRRHLTGLNPVTDGPELARSLSVLAVAQESQGNHSAARDAARQVVALLDPWAHETPDVYAPLRDEARALLAKIS